MSANYRLVATQVGDLLKWDVSQNEIGRAATALFRFARETFPNDAISSVRARSVYEWILSLAKQRLDETERDRLLVTFCRAITPEQHRAALEQILKDADVGTAAVDAEARKVFSARGFHPQVVRHSERLFLQGNYFHAVFESAKAYNKSVREKARTDKDGQALMLEVWGWRGVLKITRCETETDRNVQDGVKFLSAGLMQAIRNPTSHEPALDWPISRTDCLDILSFLSFLFRKVDDAVFVAQSGGTG
ncbi:TIGR02391 family protein [Candidatus Binatia bacterium]|nr:TIGR02391 family protein [Candidatus Binatia bacterium]